MGIKLRGEPTAVRGIRGALEVYGRLLDSGFEVYVPVMYIRHDCVIITKSSEHIDIEIKSRSPVSENTGKPHTMFLLRKDFKPRDDFFVILHYVGTDESWILPSKVAKQCLSKGGDRIIIGKVMKEKLRQYKNAYHLLDKN